MLQWLTTLWLPIIVSAIGIFVASSLLLTWRSSDLGTPEMQKKMQEGPIGVLLMRPPGDVPNMLDAVIYANITAVAFAMLWTR